MSFTQKLLAQKTQTPLPQGDDTFALERVEGLRLGALYLSEQAQEKQISDLLGHACSMSHQLAANPADLRISRSQEHLLQNHLFFLLLSGKKAGGEQVAYAYVAMPYSGFKSCLESAQSGRSFNPQAHDGLVLASGAGTPSPEVQNYIGFQFHFDEQSPTLTHH